MRAAYSQILTTREVEVALLVAQGLTNREIAARLCVSERTVDTQLASAFARLGLRRRAELAAFVGAMLCLVQACS
jgi:DNA-binding NarL/FixJ family response regulator